MLDVDTQITYKQIYYSPQYSPYFSSVFSLKHIDYEKTYHVS